MSEGGFTPHQVCSWIDGRIANSDHIAADRVAAIRLQSIAVLDEATPTDLSFFLSPDYRAEFEMTKAGVLVVPEAFISPIQASGHPVWTQSAVVTCADAYLAMAKISSHFVRALESRATFIHATAMVHPRAHVEEGAQIGANTHVDAGAFIGAGVEVGQNCRIFPNAVLYEGTRVGNDVRIHAGAVIGADGFGYAPVIENGNLVRHAKIHHIGGVVISDDVEVGANTCIDRGTFGDTRIGRGVKIDNQVQVGHNVQIGEGAIICGCTGIAGSAVIGKFVYLGGGSGVGNRVVVADHTKVAACGLVSKDTKPGDEIAGNPMRTVREHFRVHAFLNRLASKSKMQNGAKYEEKRGSSNE